MELKNDPNTLFLVGTYSIGKERVLEAVAKAASSRYVRKLSACLESSRRYLSGITCPEALILWSQHTAIDAWTSLT